MTDRLLADYIDLPDEAQRGGFVISLTDAVGKAQQTLSTYVLTPDLQRAFREALTLVTTAVGSNASRGAYIQSSFGGGKSHFLSVLTLALEHDPATRMKEGLAEVLAEYDSRLQGRKFLVVTMNMIGAKSVESAVFGGYVRTIQAKHPEAPLPAVYVADGLLENARALRAQFGDERFFATLGSGQSTAGWGDLAGGWDAARFDAALVAPPESTEREALVSALVSGPLQAVPGAAAATGEGMLAIDQGIAAISRHANALGYDAVVFMLDELILWLASQMADQAFVNREGPKVAKLVESGSDHRPAPIVAFLARQKDLNELVDEHMPHADQLRFGTVLAWWEGRFANIQLAEGNLRAIVEKRLLAPKSPAAREAIDQAFRATTAAAHGVIDTLCTATGDVNEFRQVYPFSPALVSALVDLSSVLQRERTALRVLAQLLVDRRETLRLGDLVPLGDLYDVIADGDEPFSAQIKDYWDTARRLYRVKFRPWLLAKYELTEAQVEAGQDTPAFRAGDRLVKTLLLAAIVPGSATLGNLTASRLAALNHGSIKSPIPNQERAVVATLLRELSAEIGELKLDGDPADPNITVRLLDVDTESVLRKAEGEDTPGARRQALRDMIFDSLEIDGGAGMLPSKTIVWRGTRRTVDVVFGNLADRDDVSDQAMVASGERVRIVLDFPFDSEGRTVKDDLARAVDFARDQPPTSTLCWIPQFFTAKSLTDLGNFVVLHRVLSGDNFERYASHLAVQDRPVAKQLLTGRYDALRDRLRVALRQAYRVDEPREAMVLPGLSADEQFVSLDPSFVPQRPVALDLRDAFEKLAGQQLAHRYPDHPEFDAEIKVGDLRAVYAEIARGAAQRSKRIDVAAPPTRRLMARIANKLQLGTMYEAHYEPGTFWTEHMVRRRAEESPAVLTVGDLRRWTDDPRPRGLPREIQDLVILTVAAESDLVLMRHGAVVTGEIGRVDDDVELHTQQAPPEEDWTAAVQHAANVFGLVAPPIRTAAAVARLVGDLRTKAAESRNHCVDLVAELTTRASTEGIEPSADRLATAATARALLDAIARTADDAELIHAVATTAIPTNAAALGRSISSAPAVVRALREANWTLLTTARNLTGEFAADADTIRAKVADAFTHDEFVVSLPSELAAAGALATDLVSRAVNPPPPPPQPVAAAVGPAPQPVQANVNLEGLSPAEALAHVERLRAALGQTSAGASIDLSWTIRTSE